VTLCVFLISGISYADDSVYQKHVATGVSALENNRYKDAIEEFSAALNKHPEDRAATLYLGIAQSRSGNKEAGPTLKKALAMAPKDPRTNLELGIFFYNQSAFSEAEDYFDNTKKFAPKTEYSEMADKYLAVMNGAGGQEKRWALNISLGGQYDSNVAIAPDGVPLTNSVSHKSDWSSIAYAKGGYTFISDKHFESSVGYSMYQSLHNRLSDFNVSQHVLELKSSYSVTNSLKVNGSYSFEYIFLGGDGYVYDHSISPSITVSEGKGFSTELDYRYRYSHFMNTDLFSTNADRTGSNNLLGITQSIPVSAIMAAKAGFAHDKSSAEKDFWAYRGNKVFADLKFTLPKRVYLDLYGEYYNINYDDIDPSVSKSVKRKDTPWTYSASATKALSNTYSVTAAYLYTRNKSNIVSYDYKRGITSIFLNARF
jgi:hypothetical protein